MIRYDQAKLYVDGLCAKADDRYFAWEERSFTQGPEHILLVSDLRKQSSPSLHALPTLLALQEIMTRRARKQIAIYRSVARANQCWVMLSKPRLNVLRDRIMRPVGEILRSFKWGMDRLAAEQGESAAPWVPRRPIRSGAN